MADFGAPDFSGFGTLLGGDYLSPTDSLNAVGQLLSDPQSSAAQLAMSGAMPPTVPQQSGMSGLGPFGALMSIKPPTQPSPIYSGGVAGAQHAPDPRVLAGAPLSFENIMAAQKLPPAVPTLGQLLAGAGRV